MARAPPRTLTFSGLAFNIFITARVWAAKASLISIRVDVLQLQAGTLQAFVRRRHRADAHDGRVDARHGHGLDAGTCGLQTHVRGWPLRHHQHRRRADIDRAGVARRHAAALGHERRLQCGQRSQAGIAANALVLGQQLFAALLVAAPGRNDLAAKRPGVSCFGRTLVATQLAETRLAPCG